MGIQYLRDTHGVGSRNRFSGFAQAVSSRVLRQRTGMTFVLDLGVAKRKLPAGMFGTLKDGAEKGFLGSAMQGRLRVDDAEKD